MRIQEAARRAGCSQRAVKFYEEKGLLRVARRENGYRDYSEADVERLHRIQAYRKLGVGVAQIRKLLSGEADERALLAGILEQKRAEQEARVSELAALERYLAEPDAAALDGALDYPSLTAAMRAQLPGFWGEYVAAHFAPYLPERIETPEQRDAYERIVAFWDGVRIRVPPLLWASERLLRLTGTHGAPAQAAADAHIRAMLDPSPEEYERLKRRTLDAVKARQNPLVRYSPAMRSQRRMMRALQDCGYNDVFIPQMKRLSPAYRAYYDALTALNERLAADLGLHYDAKYNLVAEKRVRP